MINKPKLAILASEFQVQNHMCEGVGRVIGDVVDIKGFSIKDTRGPIYEYPVVLTSHSFLIPEARRIFPNSEVVPGIKTINGHNLERVIRLPKGKKVLVVGTPRVISEETIQALIDLGIDHLEYVPYWVGAQINVEEFDTAISPSMGHLCPAGIETIIDIGPRNLNVVTFLELLNKLNLDLSYLTKFVNYYTSLLMYNSRKLADILGKSEILRKEQEIILNEVDEGIISVNGEGRILLVNPSLEKTLGISSEELLSKDINEFFHLIGLEQENEDDIEKEFVDNVFSYKGKNIICNKIPIVTFQDKRYIYKFKEVAKIQEQEEEVRRKLHKKGYIAKYNFNDIWGNSEKLRFAKEEAKKFAGTDNTILIIGESGTGKELFAQAIHLNSPRKNGPFLAINFAAIPESLVESELFGYEGGAFTGAKREGRPGLFEQAHGGTLLLDEIGDAPLYIQARLLRVLQEKEIMRIGGEKIIPVDVRIIAATNRNLLDAVKNKLFRADLFYRLNVLPIETPPLRERKEDILIIFEKYLKTKYGVKKQLSSEVIRIFQQYDWPGNVRELINIADYIYYSSRGCTNINESLIPSYLKEDVQKGRIENCKAIVQRLLQALDEKEEINIIYLIIKIMNSQPYGSIGRNKLLKELRKREIFVTEHKLKKYLLLLNSSGLVNTGRTKQGSSLTELGAQFIPPA